MKIDNDCVVSLDFELRDKDGELIDATSENEPMLYLHGHQNIPPALENALAGKESGADLDVHLSPAEGFGEYDASLVQEVPREAINGIDELQVGMQFPAETEDGVIMLTVLDIKGETVVLDANHPLAGEDLHFKLSIGEVRKATSEELEHGHAHGAGGHHH